MGNFFGQLVESYGQNIIEGNKQDMNAANLELKRQEVAMNKMSMMQAQQKQQTQQGVAKYISASQAADKSGVDDPTRTAQMYQQAAAMEIAGGNFQQAEELSNLSKGKLKEAADAKQAVMGKIADAKEALAKSAMDYTANPTPEGSKDLAVKALKAGITPGDIPPPGSPEWATWVTQQKSASMSTKELRDFTEKQSEFKEKQDEAKQVHKDNEADKLAQRQQTAAMQQGMREDRREARRESEARYQERKQDKKDEAEAKVGKQSSTQQMAVDGIATSTAEAVQQLKTASRFNANVTAGAFSDLKGGTVTAATEKALTNTLTSQDAKLYQANMGGMALEYARAITIGAGKGANQSTINELKETVTAHAGDTELVKLFKTAVITDALRARARTNRPSTNPETAVVQKESLDYLHTQPTAQEVLAYGEKIGKSGELSRVQGRVADVQARIKSDSTPNAAPAVSSDVQTALDKYK